MPATKLHTHRVSKPWGRRTLFPGFPDPGPDEGKVGEVWFQEPGDTTPDLLVKYLFPGEKLSVQVHPDDEEAHKRGLPRGKDECWTVLEAEPDAVIAVGTTEPMDRERLREDARTGAIEHDLEWHPVKAGDFLYCASGTIHAIGGGITLIEVQQNSETTYRLYDYGSDRELHLEDGMAVADPNPYTFPPAPPPADGPGRRVMVEGPKFVLERWAGGTRTLDLAEGQTAWLVPIKGAGSVAGVDFVAGECVTVTGREEVTAADDMICAYPGTRRL